MVCACRGQVEPPSWLTGARSESRPLQAASRGEMDTYSTQGRGMGGDAGRPPRQSTGRDSAEGNTKVLLSGVSWEPGRPPALQAKPDICKGAPRDGSGVPQAEGDGRQNHRGRRPQASTSFGNLLQPIRSNPKEGKSG